jgi:hypothetical protein
MVRPSSIGGLSCSPGNFSAPLLVSAWRSALIVDRFAFHDARGWNLGGKALHGIGFGVVGPDDSPPGLSAVRSYPRRTQPGCHSVAWPGHSTTLAPTARQSHCPDQTRPPTSPAATTCNPHTAPPTAPTAAPAPAPGPDTPRPHHGPSEPRAITLAPSVPPLQAELEAAVGWLYDPGTGEIWPRKPDQFVVLGGWLQFPLVDSR